MTMITAAAVAAGGAVVGGYLSGQGAENAGKAQLQGQREAAAAQERTFKKQTELQEPFRQAGMAGQNRLMDLLGLSDRTGAAGYGTAAQPFSMTNYQADPGYAFRLQEGLKALDRTAAARGGLLSGNQLRGAVEYGQNLGTQEYQNAFNRYYTALANQLNPLQSLAGQAQSSANTLTNAAGQYGQNLAEQAVNTGNIRASGYVNSANAMNQAISGIGNAAMSYGNYQNQQKMMNMMMRPSITPQQSYVYNAIQDM